MFLPQRAGPMGGGDQSGYASW